MKTSLRQKEFVFPFCCLAIFIVWYLLVGGRILQKIEWAVDDVITSHAFWLSSPPPEKDLITIVAIDQQTRRRMNLKWPWPRSVTGQIIQEIAAHDPSVIGLDIYFSGESSSTDDSALAEALASHPRIVAASILQPNGISDPTWQIAQSLSATGFVNRPLVGGKVRSVMPFVQGSNGSILLSMDLEILRSYFAGHSNTDIEVAAETIRLGEHLELELTDGTIPLNYLVYPTRFRTVPAHEVFTGQINPASFKDKIVLVGVTDPIVHDEYDTPPGIFPGVSIVANSLVMFLSQRFITDLPLALVILVGCIISGAVYFICKKTHLLASLALFLITMALLYTACLFLRTQDVTLEYLFFFSIPVVTFLSYNLYHYLSLLHIRSELTTKAVYDSMSGLYSPRYFRLLARQKTETDSSFALIGVKVKTDNKIVNNINPEQYRSLIKEITTCLEQKLNLTPKDIMASITPDTLGVLKFRPNRKTLSHSLESFLSILDGKRFFFEEHECTLRMNIVFFYKDSNEKIAGSDPVPRFESIFRTWNSPQKLQEISLDECAALETDSADHFQNEYDFIIYDWEEKTKELEKSFRHLAHANSRLEKTNIGIIQTLARTIDAKSPWTAGHSERVTTIAVQIGKTMGLEENELKLLQVAGLLHDVGKIGIPASILDKPGKLTDEEYRKICEHPKKGGSIIEPLDHLNHLIPLIEQHHERFDGEGYPAGLAGHEICLGARILSVADVFDALSSDRPYRSGLPMDTIIAIITRGSGTQFDPQVVQAFIELMIAFEKGPVASFMDFLKSERGFVMPDWSMQWSNSKLLAGSHASSKK